MGGRGHTSGSGLATLSELTLGMRWFSARYKQRSPVRCPAANKLTRGLWITGEQDGSPRENCWCLNVHLREACSAFPPQGPQASILLPQGTQSHLIYGQDDGSCRRLGLPPTGRKERRLYIHRGQRHQCVNETNESNLGSVQQIPLHNRSLSSRNTS